MKAKGAVSLLFVLLLSCLSACTTVQGGDARVSLLRWVDGLDAVAVVTGRPAPAAVRQDDEDTMRGALCASLGKQ